MKAKEIKRLTQGLSLTALVVGSLMTGKKYFEGWQLNKRI
jgi:hypothetical protein